MAEEPIIHKINVTLLADPKWKSKEVAETVTELLVMDNDGGGPFSDIRALPDPVTDDAAEIPEVIEEVLDLVHVYATFLHHKIANNAGLEALDEGVQKLEHGITDMKACMRCLTFIAEKLQKPEMHVARLDYRDLKEAPEGIVHAVAHEMGLDPDSCKTMSKDDMVKWVLEKVEGPRTIN